MIEGASFVPFKLKHIRNRLSQLQPYDLTHRLSEQDLDRLMQNPQWRNATLLFNCEEVTTSWPDPGVEIESKMLKILNAKYSPNDFSNTPIAESIIGHEMAHFRELQKLRPNIAGLAIPLMITLTKTDNSYHLPAATLIPNEIMRELSLLENISLRLAPAVVAPGDLLVAQAAIYLLQKGQLDANIISQISAATKDKLVPEPGTKKRVPLAEGVRFSLDMAFPLNEQQPKCILGHGNCPVDCPVLSRAGKVEKELGRWEAAFEKALGDTFNHSMSLAEVTANCKLSNNKVQQK